MKALKQINKFTFEEVEVPDHVVEELYTEWYRSDSSKKFDIFELLQIQESKKIPS